MNGIFTIAFIIWTISFTSWKQWMYSINFYCDYIGNATTYQNIGTKVDSTRIIYIIITYTCTYPLNSGRKYKSSCHKGGIKKEKGNMYRD